MCVLGYCELPGTGHDGGPDGPTDAPVDSMLIDADLSCACSGNTLTCGSQPPQDCTLGCDPDNTGARCFHVAPSNALEYTPATTVNADIVVTEDAFVNTDTGEITGGLARDAGEGEKAGIIYSQKSFMTVPLGVFWMKSLTVKSGKALYAAGTGRSLVIITADKIIVELNGKIDVSAGCGGNRACPGAGGGIGAYDNNAATGCSAGKSGTTTNVADSGGGGGGGGAAGGNGGNANATAGGPAGGKCMSDILEPLYGGSGGARGGITNLMLPPNQAGGGGGGVQLTSNTGIEIRGYIDASGEGGSGGNTNGTVNGGGNGGGAGGGILLEAPSVTTFVTAHVTANGGGGGAGGQTTRMDGSKGRNDATSASGGAGSVSAFSGTGGQGGASTPATAGQNLTNAGGGGGAVGVIVVRAFAQLRMLEGTVSPAVMVPDLRTN